ncbi:hypothetical protein N7519_004050 [Penicillium mononematosum]|uniref:uncharacterized protein n=1 Tax=Penicillium mononematosum TaxID=268346 RepID=UPI002548A8BD|nr:uncharacterized protein N7519_004050 [Penicillium mononematosum]KAJ6189142.1 hypothetical protein N7519_004050 [Penicillium mononematosum]
MLTLLHLLSRLSYSCVVSVVIQVHLPYVEKPLKDGQHYGSPDNEGQPANLDDIFNDISVGGDRSEIENVCLAARRSPDSYFYLYLSFRRQNAPGRMKNFQSDNLKSYVSITHWAILGKICDRIQTQTYSERCVYQ